MFTNGRTASDGSAGSDRGFREGIGVRQEKRGKRALLLRKTDTLTSRRTTAPIAALRACVRLRAPAASRA
jgi:hypothetical protein